MNRVRAFLRNRSGAAAAEFALVLPVALLFFFGIFDVGRYVWTINELEKAVQMGTRYAVATEVVPSDLNDMAFEGLTCPDGALTAGQTICRDALGTIACTKSGSTVTCGCTATAMGSDSCPASNAGSATAFDAIVRRMRVVAPFLRPDDVTIRYSGSGLGFAGDPATDDDGNALPDVAPLVTVEVRSITMRLMLLLGGRVSLPAFSYSQTLEDGDGTIAY